MSDSTYKTAPPDLIKVTDKALHEIQHLYQEQPSAPSATEGLRLGIKGGGCSGMSYKLAFDARQDNDYVVEMPGIQIFIDPKSAIYLKGITVDYESGLEGKGFVFINPNATSTCGCGESFSV